MFNIVIEQVLKEKLHTACPLNPSNFRAKLVLPDYRKTREIRHLAPKTVSAATLLLRSSVVRG